MNQIIAKVVDIQNNESLHVIKFEIDGNYLSMMSLDVPNVKIGLHVKLGIKPMSIVIAKNFSGAISFSNRLNATIKSINEGKLLCSVKLSFLDKEFESIMTRDTYLKMDLRVHDAVSIFIKASEISIKEIL